MKKHKAKIKCRNMNIRCRHLQRFYCKFIRSNLDVNHYNICEFIREYRLGSTNEFIYDLLINNELAILSTRLRYINEFLNLRSDEILVYRQNIINRIKQLKQ